MLDSQSRLAAALFMLGLLLGASGGWAVAAPAAAAAEIRLTQPAERYFEVGAPLQLGPGSVVESLPEPLVTGTGELVVSYLGGSIPYYGAPRFTVYNGTTGAPAAAEVTIAGGYQYDAWGNTTARGSLAALDGRDKLARTFWVYGFPNNVVSVKEVDLAGGTAIAETRVGGTGYWTPSAAIAVGANNSLHIVRAETALLFSRMAENGSWTHRNISVYNDGAAGFPADLVYNAAAGLMVVAWASADETGRVLALRDNGSVAWGPVALGRTRANLSVAAMADGSVVAVYTLQNQLRAVKLAANGSTLLADRSVVDGVVGGRTPRPVATPSGDVVVVWSDSAEGAGLEVRAVGLNATDFNVTIAPTPVSQDEQASVNPRAAAARDGSLWVVWQNDSGPWVSSIWGARVTARWSGFEASTPSGNATLYRGERAQIPVVIESLVDEGTEYDLWSQATSFGGPTNWSAAVVNATTGAAANSTALPSRGRSDLLILVDAPVVNAVGYAAWIQLKVVDRHRGTSALQIAVNVTVVQGHRYEVLPADQNATALPGAPSSVTFQVRNTGLLDEAGVPAVLSALPANASWNATVTPPSLTAAAGATANITITVTPGPEALSNQSYCARLRVQHPNDPYSLATAGFCVRAALVSTPTVDPAFAAVEVDPGATAASSWTLSNRGNAAPAIDCTLAILEALPTGWALVGNPALTGLLGDASTTVTFSISAPPSALGSERYNLTLRATCAGAPAAGEAHLELSVRPIHSVQWRTAGTSADANATGAAAFTMTVENTGNVPEPVTASVQDAPPGWAVAAHLLVGGAPSVEVPPYASGTLMIDVQSPPLALAGSYRVAVAVQAGEGAPAQLSLTVRIAKSYGITVQFTAGPTALGAGGGLSVAGLVEHLGNAADSYTLRVEVETPQYWSWRVEYQRSEPDDPSGYAAGTLSLDAFSRGTLFVNLTAPREPLTGNVTIRVSLASARGPSAEFTAGVHITLPDLGVSIEKWPEGTADPTLRGAARIHVVNLGDGASPAVRLQVTLDGAPLQAVDVPELAPGASAEIAVSVDLASGDHTISAFVDPKDGPGASPIYGAVFESDETNNAAARTFAIGAPPPPPPPAQRVTTAFNPAVLFAVAGVAGAAGVALVALRLRPRRDRKE